MKFTSLNFLIKFDFNFHQELYTEFSSTGHLLTAAVAVGAKFIDTAYELAEIHKYLHFINLMAYGKKNTRLKLNALIFLLFFCKSK